MKRRNKFGAARVFLPPIRQPDPSVKLALHRSLTFWSGILTMTFIGWAWAGSISRISLVQMGHFRFANRHAGIEIFHRGWFSSSFHARAGDPDYPVFNSPFAAPFQGRGEGRDMVAENGFNHSPEKEIESHADAIRLGTLRYTPREDWLLFVPHWLLLLFAVVVWLGLLIWRAGRIRRAVRDRSTGGLLVELASNHEDDHGDHDRQAEQEEVPDEGRR